MTVTIEPGEWGLAVPSFSQLLAFVQTRRSVADEEILTWDAFQTTKKLEDRVAVIQAVKTMQAQEELGRLPLATDARMGRRYRSDDAARLAAIAGVEFHTRDLARVVLRDDMRAAVLDMNDPSGPLKLKAVSVGYVPRWLWAVARASQNWQEARGATLRLRNDELGQSALASLQLLGSDITDLRVWVFGKKAAKIVRSSVAQRVRTGVRADYIVLDDLEPEDE